MAMAAGKSAGKPPRMTDKAFKPPTEAAMAMTGNETLARETGVVSQAALAGFFCRRSGLDAVFMILLPTPAEAGSSAPYRFRGRDEPIALRRLSKFTRKPIDRLDGFSHQPLRAGNLFLEALRVDRGVLFQRHQSGVDSQQRLGDFIRQFPRPVCVVRPVL